jgi:hypothetical protein
MEIGDKIEGVSGRFGDFVGSFNKSDMEPDPNLEYIYDHGTVFCEEAPYNLPTEYACRGRKIAVNVRKQKGYSCKYSFNFIDDETKKEYHTHYGWSLIPNTSENLLRLEEIRGLNDQINQLGIRIGAVRKEMGHLG